MERAEAALREIAAHKTMDELEAAGIEQYVDESDFVTDFAGCVTLPAPPSQHWRRASDIVERLAPCPFCGGRAEIYGGLFPPLGPRWGHLSGRVQDIS